MRASRSPQVPRAQISTAIRAYDLRVSRRQLRQGRQGRTCGSPDRFASDAPNESCLRIVARGGSHGQGVVGEALVLGPGYFPAPYGDAVAHAARRKLEPKIRPIGCVRRVVEARLAVEGVEISADELAVFHADAGIIDEIGHAAGGLIR